MDDKVGKPKVGKPKVGKPKVSKPGHWRRVGPISDRKQTELLWVRPEQWDYKRYAPAAR